ncbi:MAG TPA: universal stress protein [Cytophagales bacterium]|nr:universal stress protein [Cytophagales bacterium]HAA18979.1 universal stress protein [Cytophagales bacterium]HAP64802.1 universal stress protein [Cytophagales bacterium]
MKKILVPTDFSEQAMVATQVATQLGKNAGAKVTLLNVVEVPGGPSFSTTGPGAPSTDPSDNVFVLSMVKQAQEKMEELVNEDQFEGCDLHYLVTVGNPFSQIQEMTKEEGVDLVVMGTKGATGLEEFLVGSNTERVVRLSKAPVLTLKSNIDINNIKSIALATSLHEDDLKIAKALKDLVDATSASLHVVRINTPNNFQSDRITKNQMANFVKKLGIEGIAEHSYSDAIEEDGIIHFAEANNVDLIAMATHGRTGFLHLLSGSIAEDVVNHARRPVWTFNIK